MCEDVFEDAVYVTRIDGGADYVMNRLLKDQPTVLPDGDYDARPSYYQGMVS